MDKKISASSRGPLHGPLFVGCLRWVPILSALTAEERAKSSPDSTAGRDFDLKSHEKIVLGNQ